MITTSKLYLNIVRVRRVSRMMGIKLGHFIFPMCLALGSALFEGISIVLLIPTVRGIIKMDFGFVKEVPILKSIIANLPHFVIVRNTSIFVLLLVMIAFAVIAKNVLEYLSDVGISCQVRKFSSQLKKNIFARYLSFGKRYFDDNSMGSLNHVLLNFTTMIANQIIALEASLILIFILIAYLGIMVTISWKLTIFLIFIFPLVDYSSKQLIKKIKKSSVVWAEARTSLSKKIFNILSCMPLVKVCVTEEKERKQFNDESDTIKELEVNLDKKRCLVSLIHEIIALVMLLLFIAAVAFLVVKNKSGDVAAFVVYIVSVRRVLTYTKGVNAFRVALANIEGPMKSIWKVFDDKDKFFVADGRREFKSIKRSIEFNHLDFSYKEGTQALKDISFSIEKGKMTAIVGSTGSGKTTLINLILRFYECPSSSIFMDGIDIKEFTLKSLRSHISLVSQDPLLFDDSLRNNIVYGLEKKCTDDELIAIAKKAKLYDFILKLPEGFDTVIGDRGVQLSGGEKQRVSIARALLKKTGILILDEATSSLDTHTERLMQAAIEQAICGKTTIVIAHRLSTINNADKIIVIEDGKCIEEGTLNILLKNKGKFYKYWQEQKFY